uniref:OSJNBa0033G16.11 protein n=1 Tax=Oryza sativa subsp. japonica TaxID=39947 RepID=Q7XQE8_ORYSJ|nr:OSJNBa0033G16.11 [Oryza sativa Japonica Group]
MAASSIHASRRSSSPTAASSPVRATSELIADGRVLRHPRLTPELVAAAGILHPTPELVAVATSSIIHTPCRSSLPTAASSPVHATLELVAGVRVLLAPRLSTPATAASPAVATTHVHKLQRRARAARQHSTSATAAKPHASLPSSAGASSCSTTVSQYLAFSFFLWRK